MKSTIDNNCKYLVEEVAEWNVRGVSSVRGEKSTSDTDNTSPFVSDSAQLYFHFRY